MLWPPKRPTRSDTVYPVGPRKAGALRCEQCEITDAFHADLSLIAPDRALSDEIARVLEAGYVRGADCWHLATALYLSPNPSALTFLTLDLAQRHVAKALGFQR